MVLYRYPKIKAFPEKVFEYAPKNVLATNDSHLNDNKTTFCVRMKDDTMMEAGIHENDLLMVMPDPLPRDGDIIVGVLDGQMIVRRYFHLKDRICLVADNVNYAALEILNPKTLEICGVVLRTFPN